MCGTKTCEKWRFLMRKGTKMALKQGGKSEPKFYYDLSYFLLLEQ